jgi:hypothetical protein
MHAFIEKGIEHSAGIHYIGELKNNSITRFLFEQITEGQVRETRGRMAESKPAGAR